MIVERNEMFSNLIFLIGNMFNALDQTLHQYRCTCVQTGFSDGIRQFHCRSNGKRTFFHANYCYIKLKLANEKLARSVGRKHGQVFNLEAITVF